MRTAAKMAINIKKRIKRVREDEFVFDSHAQGSGNTTMDESVPIGVNRMISNIWFDIDIDHPLPDNKLGWPRVIGQNSRSAPQN